MQLQEVKSNPEQPGCKKKCADPKKAIVKKCEIQGGGQEMAMSRLIAKILAMTIQVN